MLVNMVLDKSNIMVKKEDLRAPLIKQLFRRASMPIASFLAKYTKVTPNQVTLVVFLLSFLNAYLFYLGDYIYLILGGILLGVRFLFDYVDGSLARIKNMGSMLGYWYDHHGDEAGKVILFLGITLGVFKQTQDSNVLIFGFLLTSAYLLGSLTYLVFMRVFSFADDVVEAEKGKRKFIKQFFFIDPFVTIIIMLVAFINQFYWFLLIASVYSWLFTIAQFVALSMRAKVHLKKS